MTSTTTSAAFARLLDQSLQTRLVVLQVALFAGVASFLVLWLPAWMDRDSRTWTDRKARAEIEILALALTPALARGDDAMLADGLAMLETQDDARAARILDARGATLTSWGDAFAFGRNDLLHVEEEMHADGTRATLQVSFSLTEFHAHRRASRAVATVVALGVLVVGGALSFVVGGMLVIPIARLTDATMDVAQGRMMLEDFRKRVAAPAAQRDEARKLAHALTLLTTQIGEQMQALRQERERAVEAEERALGSSKAKSAFLATMSHELRTPLNAIIGYAEMLMEELSDGPIDPARQIVDLGQIRSSGHHLLTLINDVLDLTKIEAGRMELSVDRFVFAPFAAEIGRHIIPLAARNENTVRFLGADSVGELATDRVRLKQCVLNLLSNACKFTEQGAIEVRATRVPTPSGDLLRIEVADTGIGIAPEHVGRLFLDFEQADASTTRRYGGTGLGLALTRRLCRLMGGDVTVESRHGHGSTFTILVPAVRVRGEARPTATHATQAG